MFREDIVDLRDFELSAGDTARDGPRECGLETGKGYARKCK